MPLLASSGIACCSARMVAGCGWQMAMADPFFLAMADWQLGNRDEARQWYDRAVTWMEKEPSRSSELMKRLQGEAAQLLGTNKAK